MTIDTDDDRMSAREYAREATRIRSRLASELDQLTGRLSFGQICDEVLGYAKGSGSTFFGAFSNATRENPIPSLLIASGCMMLLSEKMGLNRYLGDRTASMETERVRDHRAASGGAAHGAELGRGAQRVQNGATTTVSSVAVSARDGIADAAETTRQTVGDLVNGVRETAEGALGQAQETAQGALNKVQDTARGTGEVVRGYSAAIGDHVSDAATRARDQTTATAQQLKGQAQAIIEEQPLVVAAVGVALGALFAALLPPTETEDQLMGDSSDALKQAVTDTAGNVVERAKMVADREGLTPESAVEVAKEISGKVRTVVKEATETTGKNLA